VPQELWTLRPDRMQVIPGKFRVFWLRIRMDAIKTNFTANDILHLKMFAATNDFYGLFSNPGLQWILIDQT